MIFEIFDVFFMRTGVLTFVDVHSFPDLWNDLEKSSGEFAIKLAEQSISRIFDGSSSSIGLLTFSSSDDFVNAEQLDLFVFIGVETFFFSTVSDFELFEVWHMDPEMKLLLRFFRSTRWILKLDSELFCQLLFLLISTELFVTFKDVLSLWKSSLLVDWLLDEINSLLVFFQNFLHF